MILRALLQNHGVSGAELARRLGVSRQSLTPYLRSRDPMRPSADRLEEIRAALELTPADVAGIETAERGHLGHRGESPPADPIARQMLDARPRPIRSAVRPGYRLWWLVDAERWVQIPEGREPVEGTRAVDVGSPTPAAVLIAAQMVRYMLDNKGG